MPSCLHSEFLVIAELSSIIATEDRSKLAGEILLWDYIEFHLLRKGKRALLEQSEEPKQEESIV
jgi:hypothetical protein